MLKIIVGILGLAVIILTTLLINCKNSNEFAENFKAAVMPIHIENLPESEIDKKIMLEAITDYNLLLKNQEPKFAKSSGPFLDGGTEEYLGNGYKVLQVNSIDTPFGIMGYRHGPKLLFGKDDDGHYSISHVEFYSAKEHKKLMQSIKIEKDNLQKENFLEKEAK